MTAKRRLLIVTDSVNGGASAIKRGLAYRELFTTDPEWSVEYFDRQPLPYLPPVSGNLLTRPVRRLARRVGRALRPDRGPRDAEILARAREFDAVYLLKTPAADLQQRLLTLNGPRVLIDLNDAIWLPYHRAGGWDRLEEMLQTADGVICENSVVADYARKFTERLHLVPDCAQVDVFDAWRTEKVSGTFSGDAEKVPDTFSVRLGWIGSPATASALYAIWEPLERLAARHPDVELRLLGAAAEHLPRFEKLRWSSLPSYNQEQMVREALAFDAGLYPLFHVEESLARGNGKGVLYMAAGVAAVCENMQENARLIQDGVNGLLAHGPEEWLAKLDWLVTHPEERKRLGAAGLLTVREQLTDRACFGHLIDALNKFTSNSGSARPSCAADVEARCPV